MSTDNKLTVQQAAKQGNPQAIAILLNRQLQPKGITAKVSAKNSSLQIMLEAANVPNQQGLVAAMRKWIDGLGIASIQRVQIYAKQTGEDIPSWNDSFEVVRQLEEPKMTVTVVNPTIANETSKNNSKVEEVNASNLDSALLEMAKNGDTKAISELIKNSLKQPDIKVRTTLSNGLLQVVIVSSQVPKQDASVEAIPNLVDNWDSTLIDKLKVIGMREIEGSASSNICWKNDYELQSNHPNLPEIRDNQSQLVENLVTLVAKEDEEKSHKEVLDRERSNLLNLESNLAETAINEFVEASSRLNDENEIFSSIVDCLFVDLVTNLIEFSSVVDSAIFTVNQFKKSKDFTVSKYLSKNIMRTSILFQILREFVQLRIQGSPDGIFGGFIENGISKASQLGKQIAEVLPEKHIYEEDDCMIETAFETVAIEAFRNLIKLEELLEIIQKNSIYQSTSNFNQKTMIDPLEQITKLKKLKDDGIISESEFESKKKDLLDRL